jgi:hypothetical protein
MRVMPTLCYVSRSLTLTATAGVVWLGFTIRAVQTVTAAPAALPPAPASTNAAAACFEVPKSVFVIPATPQEGKDPFFPQSTRLRPIVRLTGTNPPPAVAELELKGISGSTNHRLAIINNRTFETGEEGEVISNGSRVRIKCGEIGSDSVRVIVNGKERALHLHTRL